MDSDRPAQCSVGLCCSWNELFKTIVMSNCFGEDNYGKAGAQLYSLLAQLITGSQLARLERRQPALSPIWSLMLGWHQLYYWLSVQEVSHIVKCVQH